MVCKQIKIGERTEVYLETYLYENSGFVQLKKRPAVIVCPGGGYFSCASHEADPIAMNFSAAGYQTFVLYYSIGENAVFPNSLIDLCHAVKYVRANAQEFGIDENNINICGFSAGGHLAASLGVYWNDPEIRLKSGCQNGENKPNGLILCYPVLSHSWICNSGSLQRVAGEIEEEKAKDMLNLINHVSPDTPPAFLWHTVRDGLVPCEDSINFALKLIENKVPCELHIYPNGEHGAALAKEYVSYVNDPTIAGWLELAVTWIKRRFENPEESDAPLNKAQYLKD